MTAAGFESLKWLTDLQISAKGHFVPIGSNGFYKKGGVRSRFDQQPVESQTMVSACIEAFRITKDRKWYKEARRAFEWFLGRNDLNLPLYDPTTGGCRDGLHSDRLNEKSRCRIYFSLSSIITGIAAYRTNTFITRGIKK